MITNGLDLKKVLHSMDGISKDVLTKLSEQVLFVLNMLPFSATDQDEENISRQEGILSSVLQSIAKEVCSIFHITVKNVQLAFSHPSGSLGSFTLPSENKTCPDGFLISIGKDFWQNVTRMAGGKYIDPLLLIETVIHETIHYVQYYFFLHRNGAGPACRYVQHPIQQRDLYMMDASEIEARQLSLHIMKEISLDISTSFKMLGVHRQMTGYISSRKKMYRAQYVNALCHVRLMLYVKPSAGGVSQESLKDLADKIYPYSKFRVPTEGRISSRIFQDSTGRLLVVSEADDGSARIDVVSPSSSVLTILFIRGDEVLIYPPRFIHYRKEKEGIVDRFLHGSISMDPVLNAKRITDHKKELIYLSKNLYHICEDLLGKQINEVAFFPYDYELGRIGGAHLRSFWRSVFEENIGMIHKADGQDPETVNFYRIDTPPRDMELVDEIIRVKDRYTYISRRSEAPFNQKGFMEETTVKCYKYDKGFSGLLMDELCSQGKGINGSLMKHILVCCDCLHRSFRFDRSKNMPDVEALLYEIWINCQKLCSCTGCPEIAVCKDFEDFIAPGEKTKAMMQIVFDRSPVIVLKVKGFTIVILWRDVRSDHAEIFALKGRIDWFKSDNEFLSDCFDHPLEEELFKDVGTLSGKLAGLVKLQE